MEFMILNIEFRNDISDLLLLLALLLHWHCTRGDFNRNKTKLYVYKTYMGRYSGTLKEF